MLKLYYTGSSAFNTAQTLASKSLCVLPKLQFNFENSFVA